MLSTCVVCLGSLTPSARPRSLLPAGQLSCMPVRTHCDSCCACHYDGVPEIQPLLFYRHEEVFSEGGGEFTARAGTEGEEREEKGEGGRGGVSASSQKTKQRELVNQYSYTCAVLQSLP